jgi:hypothetical protein
MAKTLIEEIRKRRKEAREMGRLIHPKPLISELRERKRIKVRLLVLQRIGDFTESIAILLRNPDMWASGVASVVVARTLSVFMPV